MLYLVTIFVVVMSSIIYSEAVPFAPTTDKQPAAAAAGSQFRRESPSTESNDFPSG